MIFHPLFLLIRFLIEEVRFDNPNLSFAVYCLRPTYAAYFCDVFERLIQ
jgi:hypothetical protein